ncbi:MAG TPA: phosphoenolpyruvate carboxykinase (ATP) [Acidobacteriota bacterium]|jgi:phosphoenolpyruvate carboxykinase (ATP)|nr:phosphoenolpyruvate carboxykinase (ATP) [Acidobacteriota bacterium]HRR56052.1 phosphoenolpyruvate carboxykinase (ATP) [Acidobacteriota bacterium]
MDFKRTVTPAESSAELSASEFTLDRQGFDHLGRVYWNLGVAQLYEESLFRNEGVLVEGGPFRVDTRPHTARAAQDKFLVEEPSSRDHVWWGEYNRPFSEAKFDTVVQRLRAFLQGRDLFVQDCFVGADPRYRIPIRIITEKAWHSLFARNMFIRPSDPAELKTHRPKFTVISIPSFKADPAIDGTRSETGILLHLGQGLAVVCNSLYGGEIKKSVFTYLNYVLPLSGVLSMHCSANVGSEGDPALLFGLSGTGKTTLSADPDRRLIGDDEHGWSDHGVFNFEAGCYAKVIRLSAESEPEIYSCTKRYGTILENVVYDPHSRLVDLDDASLTENTRASYPLSFIPKTVEEGYVSAHPPNVVFLTCDASGVLPPIARLSPEQAMYHFISGYTSKIAGTEVGIGAEPKATFSACFGAPFMVHHPIVYARLLKERLQKHGARCWLINTGWTGGPFGIGRRIPIRHTRQMLAAALTGQIDRVPYRQDRLFRFEVPTTCPGLPEEILDPSHSWSTEEEYWKRYDTLAGRYIENFKRFADTCPPEVVQAGPVRLGDEVSTR